MNKIDLKNELKKIGISSSYYSLDGGLPNEKLCLEQCDGYWIVYYSERGVKTGIEQFSSEHEACIDLYNKLCAIKNNSVR